MQTQFKFKFKFFIEFKSFYIVTISALVNYIKLKPLGSRALQAIKNNYTGIQLKIIKDYRKYENKTEGTLTCFLRLNDKRTVHYEQYKMQCMSSVKTFFRYSKLIRKLQITKPFLFFSLNHSILRSFFSVLQQRSIIIAKQLDTVSIKLVRANNGLFRQS